MPRLQSTLTGQFFVQLLGSVKCIFKFQYCAMRLGKISFMKETLSPDLSGCYVSLE